MDMKFIEKILLEQFPVIEDKTLLVKLLAELPASSLPVYLELLNIFARSLEAGKVDSLTWYFGMLHGLALGQLSVEEDAKAMLNDAMQEAALSVTSLTKKEEFAKEEPPAGGRLH